MAFRWSGESWAIRWSLSPSVGRCGKESSELSFEVFGEGSDGSESGGSGLRFDIGLGSTAIGFDTIAKRDHETMGMSLATLARRPTIKARATF